MMRSLVPTLALWAGIAPTPVWATGYDGPLIDLCVHADRVLVVSVTNRSSVIAPDPDGRGETILTTVDLQVLRTIVGPPGTTTQIEIEGGEVGNRGVTVSGYPRMDLSSRYTIFLADVPGRQFPQTLSYQHIPAEVPVSPVETLKDEWEARCGEKKPSRSTINR